MSNLNYVVAGNDGKFRCEECSLPIVRDLRTGCFSGCIHFIRFDADSNSAVFANCD
jgi:hypothetical protein